MLPTRGQPFPLGATLDDDGVNIAVSSEVADAVEVCLLGPDGDEERVELPDRTAHVWHGHLPGVGAGQRYGFRVHGPWDPRNGLRCNPNKLLIDPYATAIDGEVEWDEALFGHSFDDPMSRNDADSSPFVPRGVVTDRSFHWGDDAAPRTSLAETVVYEVHVKGLTQRHPEVPDAIRGTYAGLAHPAVIEHLTTLGVTAVELMPVPQFVHDSHLLDRGMRNYWGYNSIGFLAPHGGYSSTGTDGAQVDEFKAMVKALHAAGLEVILDVVYNHTAEGNHLGPTLSLKGLDNPAYYRLVDGDREHFFDTTGTGNSLNVGHPAALRLILDSLRYWVTEMHVDGFRFDLATALTRQAGVEDIHSAFLDLVHQDPVLAPVKLITEPWDTAGYQLGGFPARWSEWNGRYRDDVRDFWRGEPGTLGALALRLTGSGDIYSSDRRTPTASVNFVTAHDGFTLADLTAYDDKHNEANGEDNADGESDNRSWNCGAEGPTDDPDVLELRARQRRNLLGTLLISAGIPMILGGDELGRTQNGNNNAYCQDDELSWFDWDGVDKDLLAFTQTVVALRREHPALRPHEYLRGPEGDITQMVLHRPDGEVMGEDDWRDAPTSSLAVFLDGERIEDQNGGSSRGQFLLFLNAHHEPVEFVVPSGHDDWRAVLTSLEPDHTPAISDQGTITRIDRSMLLMHREPPAGAPCSEPSVRSSAAQELDERLGIGDGHGEARVAGATPRVQAADRRRERDLHAAVGARGEREAPVREGVASGSDDLPPRVRPCDPGPRDVLDRCRDAPRAEPRLHPVVVDVDVARRGADAEQARPPRNIGARPGEGEPHHGPDSQSRRERQSIAANTIDTTETTRPTIHPAMS
jgi:isoamylase